MPAYLRLAISAFIVAGCGALWGCMQTDSQVPKSRDAKSIPIHDTKADEGNFPRRLQVAHLPNAIQIHAQVISGGQPEGEAAFRELSRLGVKSIISVDGAKPEVELATKYGLRYVHLPHGYNGIPERRVSELAKAVRELEGPIYIHCHHGKHRSPAAATVACVANGLLDPQAAVNVLAFAGTSQNYQGLYRSAAVARRIDDAVLDALQVDLPATAIIPPLAEAMVQLEHAHDHLKRFAANDWKPLGEHPDLVPAHEALLMSEHFTEMLRLEAVALEPADFRTLLTQSETDSRELESLLRATQPETFGLAAKSNETLLRVSANCVTCHRQFRDLALVK